VIHKAFWSLLVAHLLFLGHSSGVSWAGNLQAQADQARQEKIVFLASGLPDESLICLSATLAARDRPAVLLIDSTKLSPQLKCFLQAYQPDRVIPIGSFPAGIDDLEHRLGTKTAPIIPWTRGPPVALWREFFSSANRAVICPKSDRSALLQAACLAGVMRAPLYPITEQPGEETALRQQLLEWKTQEIYAIGLTPLISKLERNKDKEPIRVIRLRDAEVLARAHRRRLQQQGLIENLVLANPADARGGLSPMSMLAPWIAMQRRAALLFTNEKGDNSESVISEALQTRMLHRAESLILLGDLTALPMLRRPNPVPGKDAFIEMEPMTPNDNEPFTLATGRLFADDPALVLLLLAREKLLGSDHSHPKALVVSNPSGGLPLLETFSRNTAQELGNTGYQTSALFGKEVDPQNLRQLLPEQDVFLWEGHYATLMKEYKMHEWNEPMRPSLIFLQSCLALADGKAQPFLERGAVAVLGTSTRTYSATGGACALAFFDALLYDRQNLGGCLRQAKNFLLAYSLLKEKRLGADAKLTGANRRSAWAFSLWGDPTLHWPTPLPPEDSLPPVRHTVHGHTIVIELPGAVHQKAISNKYRAQMPPNGRLAGLITPDEDDEDIKHLIPFIFVEIHLPKVPPGQQPRLHSKLPESRWVFCWDARRSSGYLLLMPRAKDRDELRFSVDWNQQTVRSQAPLLRTNN
jgi:hypothetical protein